MTNLIQRILVAAATDGIWLHDRLTGEQRFFNGPSEEALGKLFVHLFNLNITSIEVDCTGDGMELYQRLYNWRALTTVASRPRGASGSTSVS